MHSTQAPVDEEESDMNAITTQANPAASAEQMNAVLQAQKKAVLEQGAVSAETRIDRIDRAIAQLLKYQDRLAEALNQDFGHRPVYLSKLFDVAAGVGPLQHAKKHVRKWMNAEKRKAMFPLGLLGARARIEYQPLGVIGIISPWNFPVNLSFGPLANALAAGNRAMIKPSEFTPATSELMREMVSEAYDATEVAVFTGGPDVGQAFCSLAFDHLIFTGATSVARHVMAAAAKNLVPVTLELGGKSPVLVGRSADLKLTCSRVMSGKLANAGQICLAPDYCLVAEEQLPQFVEGLKAATSVMLPTIVANDDYASIINQRHFQRLHAYLADARQKGAQVIELNPANESFTAQPHCKMAPTLILDATDDMLVMQEEIFGPLMPIRTYTHYRDAVAYVSSKPRPLGLYYFGTDREEQRYTLDHTISGGVTINDVLMHVAQEDLPFGGVGPSGMGCYHGYDGFKTFSHARAIYTQTKIDVASMTGMSLPFSAKTEKTIRQMLKP
jgi:coniferyl-aldehyde dehydrogenase